jgi:hypothetical protein
VRRITAVIIALGVGAFVGLLLAVLLIVALWGAMPLWFLR